MKPIEINRPPIEKLLAISNLTLKDLEKISQAYDQKIMKSKEK